MRTRVCFGFIALVVALSVVTIDASAQRGNRPPKPASKPTPHWPDGRVNLGPGPGEKGYWESGPGNLSADQSVKMDGAFLANYPADVDKIAPFQPWAKALFMYRHETLGRDDPHPRCMPPGGPRQFMTPYGLEIVDQPEIKRMLVFSGGGNRSYRVIWMDGRPHPDPEIWNPAYFGHSVGHWEGETLVIDSVGYNERFWFTRRPNGLPHTSQLHLIERITRPDYNTMHYQVTVDDPGAYTKPFTAAWDIPWTPEDLEEYFCQDNNRDLEHLVGGELHR